ncbi:50S ribosomal protein L18 [bacterium]|nr:MAG: 50S ribosomal protein L18 [bacterium]
MKISKEEARRKRHRRVRKNTYGTPERPRLNVFKSLKHIYAQIIDDSSHTTLVSATSNSKDIKGQLQNGSNVAAAKKIGELVAKKAVEKGIKRVAFDRGGYLYHGRIKTLADAAREAGLDF